VVQVAPDAPVPDVPLVLPTEVADPDLLGRIADDYGLDGPLGRVLTALALR
jgi:hypothetical protein